MLMWQKEMRYLLRNSTADYVFGKEVYNTPCREEQISTPTYAQDFATSIEVTLKKPVKGIYLK